MSCRAMNKRDLWEIYRRWQSRQTLSQIAGNEGRDRKTVRQYLKRLVAVGLKQSGAAVEQQHFYQVVGATLPKSVRKFGNVEISSVSNDKNVAIQKKETLAATTNRLKSFIVFKEQVAQNCKSRLASFERNKCSQSQGRG